MKKIGFLIATLMLLCGCGKVTPHTTPTPKPTQQAKTSLQPVTTTITPSPTASPNPAPKPPMTAKALRLLIQSTIVDFSKNKESLLQTQRTLPSELTEGALLIGYRKKDGQYGSIQINYDEQNSQVSCEYYAVARGIYVYIMRKDFDADLVKQSIYWVSKISLNEYFVTKDGAWRLDRAKDDLVYDESAITHVESYQSYIDTLQSEQNPT